MNYGVEQSEIKKVFLRVQELVMSGEVQRNHGICDTCIAVIEKNTELYYDEKVKLKDGVLKYIELNSPFWSEFSNDIDFPVPHPWLSPTHGYAVTHNLWAYTYGDTRKRLLQFLIDSTIIEAGRNSPQKKELKNE